MEKDKIFRLIQEYTESVPLILIGTGGTIPYGLPGMSQLADYLLKKLNAKYEEDEEWIKFSERLKKDIDLESSLTGLNLKDYIINDIVIATWELVSQADLNLLGRIISEKYEIPLSRLIKRFYQPHPQCVNIITTNYDRVIEYACDKVNIPVDTKFNGSYIKSLSGECFKGSKIVNLLKVHGSLDLFKDESNYVYSIPIQSELPNGFTPVIITPGSSKYRSVLQGACRQALHNADDIINKASSYLCIGYGFNDEQIQENIILEINKGKPIIVVTKEISLKAYELIKNNSKNYVIIQEGKKNKGTTEILSNDSSIDLEGTFWTVDGFMEIID